MYATMMWPHALTFPAVSDATGSCENLFPFFMRSSGGRIAGSQSSR